MRIDLTDGVLIEGDPDELRDLARHIRTAVDLDAAVETAFVTDDGDVRFKVRCQDAGRG